MTESFTPPAPLQTAVLFLVFNRPDTTSQVFEAIRKARPPRLYIAADGPRSNRKGEHEKVAEVREIATAVDWPCNVKCLFRDENLGCKYAVSTAISWFFEYEEHGIILEDDCLPSQSFFWFSESMLKRYKSDLRIWHVSGASTLEPSNLINDDSYYFSKYNHIWGWATWSSRWKHYDLHLEHLDAFVDSRCIENLNFNSSLNKLWLDSFRKVSNGLIDTWDYQWYFAAWINGGLSIIPTKNMISNIGFNSNATHTFDDSNNLANKPRCEIDLNLSHPSFVMSNFVYDQINARNLFDLSFKSFLKQKLKRFVRFTSRVIKK